MIDTIRAIIISEATPMKVELVDQLKKNITNITCVNTMVDGLSAIKDKQFDAAILSIDMEDFYTVSNMVRILLEVGSLRYILLVSEQEEPENETGKKQIHALHLLSSQEATNQIMRDLKEMKFTLEAAESMAGGNESMAGYAHESSSLFDSVPLGLYRIDPEGNFLDINQTMVSILRAPNDAVLRAENYFSLFKDLDQQKTWKEIIEQDWFIHGLIFEIERYDGEAIWIRDNARTVLNADKQVVHIDGTIEDITYQKKLEDKLSFLATQDILTGLPNRNFFQDQAKLTISQARYNEDLVAILIINVDKLSEINEAHSHKAGDRLLQLIAGRIKAQVRKSDLVARLGGDKFIVLLNGLRNRRDVLAVSKKISLGFAEPFLVQDKSIQATASTGISLYPEHGDDVNTLIKHAEIATFAVKERERGGYMIYSNIINTNYKTQDYGRNNTHESSLQ
ncbi:MAG: sensor domain-containing diguanylate cyclase [Sphaerochaeta sp.]|nr:sensor domain-containing diguanylate cyclase [Sphaerochaeta sp.]